MAAFVGDPAAVYAFTGQFFRSLRDSGVEHVVISPGSRSTPLSITARHTPGLQTTVELDERAAGFFALGLAKASGRPAVLVCTSGTAAANYLPAVVEAHYARVPMILATTDRPAELRDWGAGQTIEQVGLYGGYVRWAVELPTPAAGDDGLRYAGQLAGRAVDESVGIPSGAVHLNWPLREPLPPPVGQLQALIDGPDTKITTPRFSRANQNASPTAIRALAALAKSAARGVICAGPMDADPALRSAVESFASAAGWPVLADPASNLRSGETCEQSPILDAGDLITRAPSIKSSWKPEVVVRIGDVPVSKAQRLWIESAEPNEVIWLDEGGQWGEPSHRATQIIRGGATSLLAGASADLHGAKGGGGASHLRKRAWCRGFEEANAVGRQTLDEAMRDKDQFCGLAVAGIVARSAPAGAQLFSSNSMSIRLLDLAFAKRSDPLRVFASRGASGIDGIPSTALGIAAAQGTPTILLTGDLAFLHDLSGLLLTKRVKPPLTIVILDDNGGGIFSMLPVAQQGEEVAFRELFHTPHDVDLARVATLYDLDYHCATDAASLANALSSASKVNGVSMIHVPIDSKTNERRFRDAVAQAVEVVDASLVASAENEG